MIAVAPFVTWITGLKGVRLTLIHIEGDVFSFDLKQYEDDDKATPGEDAWPASGLLGLGIRPGALIF